MMKDEDITLIERYFVEGLTADEMRAFEQRQISDPEFEQAVTEYADTVQHVRLAGRKALKTRLSRLDEQVSAVSPKRQFPYSIIVVLALLAALAALIILRRYTQGPVPAAPMTPQAVDSTVTIPVSPVDTTAIQDTASGRSKIPTSPATPRKPTTEALFAAHFRPFKDPSIEPSVRGDGDTTPEEYFYQLYWKNEYRAALGAFEQMEAASKQKDNLRFLKANCLLAEGRSNAAATLLDSIVSAGRTRFPDEARWLLALTLLKQNKRAAAQAMLSSIATDAASAHQREARQILQQLQ